MNNPTKRIARLSVLAALGVVLLLLANLIPAGRIGLVVVASFPVCAALMMYGRRWSAAVFVMIAGLGMLLFPGVTAITFAAFFGYYPIAKSLFERIKNRSLVWILKYALYGAAFAAYWFLAKALFPAESYVLPWYLLLAAGAVVFGVYDWCYSLLIKLYIEKIARYFP